MLDEGSCRLLLFSTGQGNEETRVLFDAVNGAMSA